MYENWPDASSTCMRRLASPPPSPGGEPGAPMSVSALRALTDTASQSRRSHSCFFCHFSQLRLPRVRSLRIREMRSGSHNNGSTAPPRTGRCSPPRAPGRTGRCRPPRVLLQERSALVLELLPRAGLREPRGLKLPLQVGQARLELLLKHRHAILIGCAKSTG